MNARNTMLLVLLTAVMALAPWVAQAQQDTSAEGAEATELAERNKYLAQRFRSFLTTMAKVADSMEKTDPESAKVIREARNQAERALLLNDMEAVRELLLKGILDTAEGKQGEVIQELREIYRYLIEGEMSQDERLDNIKRLEQYRDAIDATLEKQRELERASDLLSRAGELRKQMADLEKQLGDLIDAQQKLRGNSQAASADQAVAKLQSLRDAVESLMESQKNVNESTLSVGQDKLPAVGAKQEEFAAQAKKVRDSIAQAANDPAVGKAVKQGGGDTKDIKQAADKVAQAAGEMSKSAEALSKTDPISAASPQKQAMLDLENAHKALGRAIAKASEGTPAGKLAKKQKELEAQARNLADQMNKLGGQAGQSGQQGQSGQSGQSGKSGQSGQQGKPKADMKTAADQMNKAADKLAGQDTDKATDHQKKALDAMRDSQDQLAKVEKGLEKKLSQNPADQAGDQQKLADTAEQIARQMDKDNQEGKSTPGGSQTSKASKSMGEASQGLSQGKSDQANQKQKEAIEQLQIAKEELERRIEEEKRRQQAEALAKIDQLLQKALDKQRMVSKGTRELDDQHAAGDPFTREQKLALTRLSAAQGEIGDDDLKIVQEMLEKEGSLVVFPQVLDQVRADSDMCRELLGDQNPGDYTQAVQKNIETALEQMIDSIREELAERGRAKSSGGGQGGKGGGKKPPLLPPTAELKMLLQLQTQVQQRTTLVHGLQEDRKLSSERVQAEHKSLAERQGKILDMAKDIKENAKKK